MTPRVRIIREPLNGDHTPGVVFVNDLFFGFSLEDPVREVPGQPVSMWKVRGLTAIPAGDYDLEVALSPKRGYRVPWVLNVNGFSAIQIHALNTARESEGCIGIGYKRTAVGIAQSRPACDKLTEILVSNGGRGRLRLEHVPVW